MTNLFLPKIKSLSFYEWILLLFPLCLVIGPFWVNFSLILSSIIFFYELIKKNLYHKLKLKWIYFYLIFVFYTILHSFFATDFLNSLQSSFFQFRYLLFE
jgi:hypothetical protein